MLTSKMWLTCIVTYCSFYSLQATKDEFALSYQSQFPAKIFLIETSGSSKLNPRQACAIESAARHHRYSEIEVLLYAPEPIEDPFYLSRTLSNIRIKSAKLESIFVDTPLWKWYQNTKWKNPTFRIYDISDASRVLLIWKYGGIYLDLDTVTLRSLYGNRNFLVKSFQGRICNGIFGFENHHAFLSKYLELFPKVHKKETWASAGPTLFTKVFASLCQHSALEGSYYPRCNITLLPIITAFPVNWNKWRDYFDKMKTRELLTKMKESSLIHVWNYLSSRQYLSINSGSLYEKAIKENCPIVYRHLVKHALLNESFRF